MSNKRKGYSNRPNNQSLSKRNNYSGKTGGQSYVDTDFSGTNSLSAIYKNIDFSKLSTVANGSSSTNPYSGVLLGNSNNTNPVIAYNHWPRKYQSGNLVPNIREGDLMWISTRSFNTYFESPESVNFSYWNYLLREKSKECLKEINDATFYKDNTGNSMSVIKSHTTVLSQAVSTNIGLLKDKHIDLRNNGDLKKYPILSLSLLDEQYRTHSVQSTYETKTRREYNKVMEGLTLNRANKTLDENNNKFYDIYKGVYEHYIDLIDDVNSEGGPMKMAIIKYLTKIKEDISYLSPYLVKSMWNFGGVVHKTSGIKNYGNNNLFRKDDLFSNGTERYMSLLHRGKSEVTNIISEKLKRDERVYVTIKCKEPTKSGDVQYIYPKFVTGKNRSHAFSKEKSSVFKYYNPWTLDLEEEILMPGRGDLDWFIGTTESSYKRNYFVDIKTDIDIARGDENVFNETWKHRNSMGYVNMYISS